MAAHEKFHYQDKSQLAAAAKELGVNLPLGENTAVLRQSISLGSKVIPNRLCIHPMEGCDGEADGKPSELVRRRYRRFAQGGAGLLWFEATAVVNEGRANPRQLMINEENREALKTLLEESLNAAKELHGKDYRPFTVVQLTHSGRYSRPSGKAFPIIACRNPLLDAKLPADFKVISDEELATLEDTYVEAAAIAAEIGFDAVDIKCCHGYLLAELLSAYDRPGIYGGSFENRTRFLTNVIAKIKAKLGEKIEIAVRLNSYDAYAYGWAVDKQEPAKADLTETKKLVSLLHENGVRLFNISAGNPYYNPHIGRPYDIGSYIPPVNPIEGVANLLTICKELQATVPEAVVIATGFSWLRHHGAEVAAGGVETGWFKMAGFGRQAFAYPDFAKDILENGAMDQSKICIACSKCTAIMRDGGRAGCVPRDAAIYVPIYREVREGKPVFESKVVAEHV
ncbi:hypothetical protein [Sporomusa sp.]|uniref:oxidoreductase n=1 Tax=Sporomusa sp. TaxID=2078658 RepID=UPI002B860FBF|nr:hypothetical protein [Sporomusa sp.]HWR41891.1 hypothetical protein [Sporomusa sp.]